MTVYIIIGIIVLTLIVFNRNSFFYSTDKSDYDESPIIFYDKYETD